MARCCGARASSTESRFEHRPPATPHLGGHIERRLGTLMQAPHELYRRTNMSFAHAVMDGS